MQGDVLIAHRMNGVRLPPGHGFPARIIAPGHYGMKSVQWLTEIEVVPEDYQGYYQQKGWTDEAIVKTMSWIEVPTHGETLKGLRQRILGLAFAGLRGLQGVEVSVDEGESWQSAALADPLSPFAWRFWALDWQVPRPGRYTLAVRAIDGLGKVQTSVEQEPAPDGAAGLHQITVSIEA
jgi:DMSO/TMAO reductase YedYZ molybdopterin-dependent catalytic subunit